MHTVCINNVFLSFFSFFWIRRRNFSAPLLEPIASFSPQKNAGYCWSRSRGRKQEQQVEAKTLDEGPLFRVEIKRREPELVREPLIRLWGSSCANNVNRADIWGLTEIRCE